MLKNTTPWSEEGASIDVKRKRAIAEALMAAQNPNGQFFSNGAGTFYGGGTTGQIAFTNALSKALGAYINSKADQDEKANIDKARTEYNRGYDMLTTPSERESRAPQDESIFTYTHPEQVGPQQDGPETFPVRPQPQMVSRPLPQVAPAQATAQSAAALAPAIAAAGKPMAPTLMPEQALKQAKSEAMANPAVVGLNVGDYNTWVQNRTNELMGASKQVPQVDTKPHIVIGRGGVGGNINPNAVPPQAPAPQSVAPTRAQAPAQAPAMSQPAVEQVPPMPQPTADEVAYEQAMAARAAQAQAAQGPSHQIDQTALARVIAERNQAEQARMREARDVLSTTKKGAALMDALQAAELQRRMKGKGEDEFVTTSLGDGQFVVTNKRTGQVVTGGSQDAGGIKPKDALDARIKIDGLRADANVELNGHTKVLQSVDRARDAVSKYGPKFGGVLGKARLQAGLIAGEKDAVEFNNALQGLSVDGLKAAFGGNTSNVELTEQAKLFGSDGSVPQDVLLGKLDQIASAATRGKKTWEQRVTNLKKEYKAAGGKDDEDEAPRAPVINGIPAYQRGMTIRPQ